MTNTSEIANVLNEQLATVSPDQATRETPELVTVQTGSQAATMAITAIDQLACAVRSISIPASFAQHTEQLKKLGELLADRLQYLIEPIATIELDADARTLQMRSQPPTEHGNRIRSYYELVGELDQVVLKRYTSRGSQPRSQIDMHFTREILPRLLTDLFQAVREVNS